MTTLLTTPTRITITAEQHLTALNSAAYITKAVYAFLPSLDIRELINAAWLDMTERKVLGKLINKPGYTHNLLITVCKRSMQSYLRDKYDTRHNRCPSLAFLSTSIHDYEGELKVDPGYDANIGQELEDSEYIRYVVNNCGLKDHELLTAVCILQRCTITEICDRLGITRAGYFHRQRRIMRKIKRYEAKQNKETVL